MNGHIDMQESCFLFNHPGFFVASSMIINNIKHGSIWNEEKFVLSFDRHRWPTHSFDGTN